jgi:hypothetical protein
MHRVEDSRLLNAAVPLEASQIDHLAQVLGNALHDEPSFVYMMPDARIRRTLSPWFFRSAIRACQSFGSVYTTQAMCGGALWLSPAQDLTFDRMVRTGMFALPFRLEWPTFKRCVELCKSVDKVRKQLAPRSHWYLLALGMESSTGREDVGGVLIEPVLRRADSTGLPCYLETFDEKSLPFYKRHGFRITGAGRIVGDGPSFWVMTRPPYQG